MPDELLAHRLRAGDIGGIEFLELLYKRYARRLRAGLVAQRLDAPTAKRIVQITLDKIPEHADDFCRCVRAFGGIEPFLRSVTESAANDVRRYRRGRPVSAAFKAGMKRAKRRRPLSAI